MDDLSDPEIMIRHKIDKDVIATTCGTNANGFASIISMNAANNVALNVLNN